METGALTTEGSADAHQHGDIVTITVDNKPVSIHRGHQTVAAIKLAGNVNPAYDLEQIVDGRLVLLPDDGAVVIKGDDVFVSHPKSGTSS